MGEALTMEVNAAVKRWGSRELAACKLMMREALLFQGRRRQMHFSVLTDSRKEPPSGVCYHWQLANMFGVSFDAHDTAAAEAWLLEAMHAGYCPILHWRARKPGHMLNVVREALGFDGLADALERK